MNRKEKKNKGLFRRIVKYALILGFIVAGIPALLFVLGLWYYGIDLPTIDSLKNYSPPQVTKIYSADGYLIDEFYKERRTVVPLNQIPEILIKAVIAAEDRHFYQHKGLDYLGMLRAILITISKGKISQGASTITQQLVKNFLLTPEKTFSRKIKEIVLARRIEANLSKDEILYLYLNQIYLGSNCYGVQEAVQFYFDRDVSELDIAQAATIASLPQRPSRLSPFKNPKALKSRQVYVLKQMESLGYISKSTLKQLTAAPIEIKRQEQEDKGIFKYFTEYVKADLLSRFGKKGVYLEGLKVYTTLNYEYQKYADKAVKEGLLLIDKRYRLNRPMAQIAPHKEASYLKALKERQKGHSFYATRLGLIVKFDKNRDGFDITTGDLKGLLPQSSLKRCGMGGKQSDRLFKRGDVLYVRAVSKSEKGEIVTFSIENGPQAALISFEPVTRHVKALVGGYDFYKSAFDRVVKAKRQIGSAIKPLLFAAAFAEKKLKLTPASILMDSQELFQISRKKWWRPKNYDGQFKGAVNLRYALAHSINMVAIKVLKKVGIGNFQGFQRRLGITTPIPENLTIAIGSQEVSLLEITNAFSTFAAYGKFEPPVFILKVEKMGQVIYEHQPNSQQVLTPELSYLTVNMMESVITEGTGRSLKRLGVAIAGKTGTSNKSKNCWFIGATPYLMTGVWVGYDDERPLKNETGSTAAIPIWQTYMAPIVKVKGNIKFVQPAGIVTRRIDKETGLLAHSDVKDSYDEKFIPGSEPKKYALRKGEFDEERLEENEIESLEDDKKARKSRE